MIWEPTNRILRAFGVREIREPGPMNLGPKDERLTVKRDTLESLLVAINFDHAGRRKMEANRLRRILRSGGE